MAANAFQQLRDLKKDNLLVFEQDGNRLALAPDLGGRVFAEVAGLSMHRIDLACVAHPDQPFNNYGGGNFWPAPEGGPFGFNYRGQEWYVQAGINFQPFAVISAAGASAVLQKRVLLKNRAGTDVDVIMRREVSLSSLPPPLADAPLRGGLAYQTADSFEVLNAVDIDRALIACWTLEQFDATATTLAFGIVDRPAAAINFDFYEHPGARIAYYRHGFTYRTDGCCRGQIGIKKEAQAVGLGYYNAERRLLCLRQNCGPADGCFFNIADNDQPGGPYSAADNYSIFNSDRNMGAFELETIGPAMVEGQSLKGARLVSSTVLAVWENPDALNAFVAFRLGPSGLGRGA